MPPYVGPGRTPFGDYSTVTPSAGTLRIAMAEIDDDWTLFDLTEVSIGQQELYELLSGKHLAKAHVGHRGRHDFKGVGETIHLVDRRRKPFLEPDAMRNPFVQRSHLANLPIEPAE